MQLAVRPIVLFKMSSSSVSYFLRGIQSHMLKTTTTKQVKHKIKHTWNKGRCITYVYCYSDSMVELQHFVRNGGILYGVQNINNLLFIEASRKLYFMFGFSYCFVMSGNLIYIHIVLLLLLIINFQASCITINPF